MSHNVLITGASGYLGGDLLAGLSDAKLPTFGKLYALVRTPEQAKAVQQYGAEPLTLDVTDGDAIRDAIVSKKITIVFFLINSFKSVSQELFIKALGEVKKKIGSEVHFLHTSGAKMFSSHAGAPADRQLYDDDPDLYTIHKAQRPRLEPFKIALNTNNTIVELAEANQVRSYVFVPCIVYKKGRGFSNPISIQTIAYLLIPIK
ncbi:nad dependent epimerase dehydratase family, partial [Fusarium albosuccineum]